MAYKYLWYGPLLWVIMFALASLFVGYGVMSAWYAQTILLLVSPILAAIFIRGLSFTNRWYAFGLGIAWSVIGIVLDLLITRQFDSSVFYSWVYWTSYALIPIASALSAHNFSEMSSASHTTHAHQA